MVVNRGRKESVEIFDKDKQNPEIGKLMNAYIDKGEGERPSDTMEVEVQQVIAVDEAESEEKRP